MADKQGATVGGDVSNPVSTATSVATIGLCKMHIRPGPGQSVVLQMRDGSQRYATATRVISTRGDGIILYHKGIAVDESQVVGWFPKRKGA